jgi:hypothetical protein
VTTSSFAVWLASWPPSRLVFCEVLRLVYWVRMPEHEPNKFVAELHRRAPSMNGWIGLNSDKDCSSTLIACLEYEAALLACVWLTNVVDPLY